MAFCDGKMHVLKFHPQFGNLFSLPTFFFRCFFFFFFKWTFHASSALMLLFHFQALDTARTHFFFFDPRMQKRILAVCPPFGVEGVSNAFVFLWRHGDY